MRHIRLLFGYNQKLTQTERGLVMSNKDSKAVKLGETEYSTIESQLAELDVAKLLNEKTAYSYIYYHRKALGKAIQVGHKHYYHKQKLRSAILRYVGERVPKETTSSLPTMSAEDQNIAKLVQKLSDPEIMKVLRELIQ